MRELQKVAGYGRIKPPPVTGVYIAPPATPEKARFRTHEAIVIAGGDRPTPEALAPFSRLGSRARHEIRARNRRENPKPRHFRALR